MRRPLLVVGITARVIGIGKPFEKCEVRHDEPRKKQTIASNVNAIGMSILRRETQDSPGA
jgi:hypothetical protein